MTAALAPRTTCAPPRRVVLRPAPRREPPFDDELDTTAALPTRFDRRLPFELVRPEPPRLPVGAGRSGLPDPAAWGRRLLVGMVETAGGRRPLHQLAAFLTPSVHRGIGAEFERASVTGRPHWLNGAGVRTVRASQPAEGVAELCAVLDNGTRVRAVAMRVELQRGRWRCTRLQIG